MALDTALGYMHCKYQNYNTMKSETQRTLTISSFYLSYFHTLFIILYY